MIPKEIEEIKRGCERFHFQALLARLCFVSEAGKQDVNFNALAQKKCGVCDGSPYLDGTQIKCSPNGCLYPGLIEYYHRFKELPSDKIVGRGAGN